MTSPGLACQLSTAPTPNRPATESARPSCAPLSPMTVATNFLWFHACVATETELRLVRRQSSGTGRGERHCDRDTVPTTSSAPCERDEAEQLTESHTAA